MPYYWIGRLVKGENSGEFMTFCGLTELSYKQLAENNEKVVRVWKGTFKQIETLAFLRDAELSAGYKREEGKKILLEMERIR